MRDYPFTLNGVSIVVRARTLFEACGIAGTEFIRQGVDVQITA